MPDSLTSEPEPESDFVCDCDVLVREACAGEPFYRELEGKRYCVLHFPSKEKSADFEKALQQKLENKDFNFRGVWFPDELKFSRFTFNAPADFSSAKFSAEANFSSATFSAAANFSSGTFSAAAYFGFATFSAEADFRFATFSAKANFSSATFSAGAAYYRSAFSAEASFSSATFSAEAYFSDATFSAAAATSALPLSAVRHSLALPLSQITLDLQELKTSRYLPIHPDWICSSPGSKKPIAFHSTHSACALIGL
jgi:hypothetical protein